VSEEYLVRNCAPTLAGLKTGNMFTCPYESKEALLEDLRKLNNRLRPKGLRLIPLRFSQSKALLYLFRPAALRRDLSHSQADELLRCQGYCTGSCEKCVGQLAKKLRRQEDFPHEVGLFLGYPPEDVHGFICQGPDRCKATGCWKVYGDEETAKKKFAQFKHCTKVYCRHWAKKQDLDRLAVAR
jgi:hypothetical protein